MLTILLAVDGSENAARACRHVARLAQEGASLHAVLLAVSPPIHSGEVGAISPVEVLAKSRAAAAAGALAQAREILAHAGMRIEERIEEGEPAEAIVRASSAFGCEAIVMGRRGLGAIAGALLGSVSESVLRHAQVPVTLVR